MQPARIRSSIREQYGVNVKVAKIYTEKRK